MNRLKKLADAAEVYARQLDLNISPSLHITKALQGIPEGRERDLLFGEIRKELNKREQKRKKEQRDLAEALAQKEKAQKQERLRDAWGHQMRQPRDAWDPLSGEPEEEES